MKYDLEKSFCRSCYAIIKNLKIFIFGVEIGLLYFQIQLA